MARDQLSRAFAALADPTRRDLVARLSLGDATVGELAAPYRLTPQAISKHLKVLEEAGLVTRRRDAQRRPVHLEAQVLDQMAAWIERYRVQAEERFRRLDAVLDQMAADERAAHAEAADDPAVGETAADDLAADDGRRTERGDSP